MRLQDLLAPQSKYLKYIGGCGTCPRKVIDFVPATLRPTKIIFVGEAPGETEVKEKEGFTGKSGGILRSAIEEVGIREFSFTNTIHCRPPENRDPTPTEISCCMNQHILGEVEPYPFVVLVGGVAMNAFFPGNGYLLKGNLAYHPDFANSRFYGVIHPASIFYGSDEEKKRKQDEFYSQVDRLGRIYRGEQPKFKVIRGAEFSQRFASVLLAFRLISLDLETNQLESWVPGGVIKSLAVCPVPGDEVFVIDKDDPFFSTALQLVAQYLQDPENQVLGQNIGFDLVWLEALLNFRCDLKYIHDIQGLYYQLDGARQAGLKRLVSEKLDGYRHLVIEPHKEKDLNRLTLYNAEDTYHPQVLFLQDFPRLKAQTQNLYLNVSGPSSLALRRIQHAGIHFRSHEWDDLVTANRGRRNDAVKKWALADPQFKPDEYVTKDGTRGIGKFLLEVKKYPVLKKTPKGEPSWDEETIHSLIRGGAKELEPLLVIREEDKEYSTYLKPYPELLCQATGRIHASYHNTTVSTGRLSSSDPNMQNVKKGPVRNLFGCPPGSLFVEGDWSQIELRLAMSEANEPNGIQAYRDGKDLHLVTASFITGKPEHLITEAERTDAKPANFCLIYGGSPPTLQAYAQNTYGISMSEEEAKRWHRGFFQLYPRLIDWHQAVIQRLRENKGYMESAVGHVWFYSDWDSSDGERRSHAERSAINMLCQGPAAYFTTYLLYLVQQGFWKEKILSPKLGFAEIILTVHDQFAWEVSPEYLILSIDVVRRGVQHVERWISGWMKVPLVLDLKVGEAWGTLKKMEA